MARDDPVTGEPRCAVCRFWLGSFVGDDRGNCRRYAPKPAHQWDGFTGEAIIAVADILSRHLGVEWPDGVVGEATESRDAANFPKTYNDDWCGEFEATPHPPTGAKAP